MKATCYEIKKESVSSHDEWEDRQRMLRIVTQVLEKHSENKTKKTHPRLPASSSSLYQAGFRCSIGVALRRPRLCQIVARPLLSRRKSKWFVRHLHHRWGVSTDILTCHQFDMVMLRSTPYTHSALSQLFLLLLLPIFQTDGALER